MRATDPSSAAARPAAPGSPPVPDTAPAAILSEATGRGILFAVLAMFAFASGDAVVKYTAQSYSLPQLLWVRYLVLCLLVLGMAVRRDGPGGIAKVARSKNLKLQIFRSVFLVGEALLFTLSFKLLPIADVHAIVAVAPIFVTALAALWLKEPVGARRWIAVLVGFAGVMVILRPGFATFDLLLLLPVAAASAFAVYQIMLRVSARYDDGQVSQFYTGVVPLVVVSLVIPFFWTQPDLMGWVALIGGGLCISVAHLLLVYAFQHAAPAALQPFNYTLLVWATLFGWLFFNDLPDALTITGAMIVVASGLYTIYRERLRARKEKRKKTAS